MKKLTAIIVIALCLVSVLTGCSMGEGDKDATSPTGVTDKNNGTVTDGDGFIGNEDNENQNQGDKTTLPDVTDKDSRRGDMFDNVL